MQRTMALEFFIVVPRDRAMSVQCLVGAGIVGAVLSMRPLGIMLPLLIRIWLRRLMSMMLMLLLLFWLLLQLLQLLQLFVCRPVRLGLSLGLRGRGVVGGDLDLVCNGSVECRV